MEKLKTWVRGHRKMLAALVGSGLAAAAGITNAPVWLVIVAACFTTGLTYAVPPNEAQ